MTAPLNGHKVPEPAEPLDPRPVVAGAMHAALADEGETFDSLADDERQDFLDLAEHAVASHTAWLLSQGFKIVPPGATPIPKTQEEAMGMVQAAKAFFDAQKRRGKLMDGAVSRKVILPKGTLQ